MELVSAGLVILVATFGLTYSQEDLGEKHFISTNNEILTAFSWATLDQDVLAHQQNWILSHDNYISTHHENFTEVTLPKTRKRRTLQLEAYEDAYHNLEVRFIIPLFEVYEGTFFRFEVPISYSINMGLLTTTSRRSWDDGLGPMMTQIEDLVSMIGVDGRSCVKRTICEVAAAPSLNLHGFVGEVVQIFLRHMTEESLLQEVPKEEENKINIDAEKPSVSKGEYMKAGQYGRDKGNCAEAYSECPFSLFNLWNLSNNAQF